MREGSKLNQQSDVTMRELTIDELDSVSGGTTFPPEDCPCGKGCS